MSNDVRFVIGWWAVTAVSVLIRPLPPKWQIVYTLLLQRLLMLVTQYQRLVRKNGPKSKRTVKWIPQAGVRLTKSSIAPQPGDVRS